MNFYKFSWELTENYKQSTYSNSFNRRMENTAR